MRQVLNQAEDSALYCMKERRSVRGILRPNQQEHGTALKAMEIRLAP